MRLIDAMEYRKVLNEEMDYQLEHCKDSLKYRLGLEIAIADLGDMPAIDAVPVVRCKDCKNYGDEYFCPLLSLADYNDPNDYCSYGERKEGAGNG